MKTFGKTTLTPGMAELIQLASDATPIRQRFNADKALEEQAHDIGFKSGFSWGLGAGAVVLVLHYVAAFLIL